MKALLFRSLIEPPRRQGTKTQKLSPRVSVSWQLRGEQLIARTNVPGTETVPTPSGSTCAAQVTSQSGRTAAGCADHEMGLLELADALLRNVAPTHLQPAYAGTLAHVNRCPACRATLADLVLTTLRYETHLTPPAGPDPTEEGRYHDA